VPTWSHLEVLLVEPDRNPVYDQMTDWMNRFSEGSVQVPHFGQVVWEKVYKATE
jgi:hypothetical protein